LDAKQKKKSKLMAIDNNILPKVWKGKNNDVISCSEKIKLLNENIIEIKRMSDDAIEDAILMGADEKQVIDTIIKSLKKVI
jgi:hypothetical protein